MVVHVRRLPVGGSESAEHADEAPTRLRIPSMSILKWSVRQVLGIREPQPAPESSPGSPPGKAGESTPHAPEGRRESTGRTIQQQLGDAPAVPIEEKRSRPEQPDDLPGNHRRGKSPRLAM